MNLYRNDNLRVAFDLYVRRQDALLPTEEELSSVTLSPEFHARMAKLLARRKRGYYRMFGTWGRRVASILIAVLLALTTATVSVKAWREAATQFFTKVYEKYTQVWFADEEQDAPKVAFEKRTPSYIPKGYVVEKQQESAGKYSATYVNDNGERIHFLQTWKQDASMKLNTEDVVYREITVNELKGVVYVNQGSIVIVFADQTYVYSVSGVLNEDELIKISESVLKE